MSTPRSILVVTASPDQRRSTEMLQLVTRYLEHTPEVRVSVWFLRCDPGRGDDEPWPGGRVVDDLRTWWPVQVLDHSPLAALADLARGRRLRRWLRQVRPDIVLLDDGLGDRVLDPWPHPVARVVRRNPEPPRDLPMEPPPLEVADILIERQPPAADDGIRHMELPELRDRSVGCSMADPRLRARLRAELDLPEDAQLVVGWGEDAWLDGADLFLRTMWALGARHGVEPHALWLGLSSDPHEADRIRTEAARCGLGQRFHLHPLQLEQQRYIGDAVVRMTRTPDDPEPLFNALCSGTAVITPVGDALPDGVTTVPPLDTESAATELRDALARDDRDEIAARHELLDADRWLRHHRWAQQLVRCAEG